MNWTVSFKNFWISLTFDLNIGFLFSISLLVLQTLATEMARRYLNSIRLSKHCEIQEVMNCEELVSLTCIVLVQVLCCFTMGVILTDFYLYWYVVNSEGSFHFC